MSRKPVLDHSSVLSIHCTVMGGQPRQWQPRPGLRRTDMTTWTYRDGRVAGRIGHVVEIRTENAGTLTLEYKLNGEEVRQVFDLIGRPCRFGGVRWLARCPRTGRAVAKLYGCCGYFLPRDMLNASYRSQDRVPTTEKLRDREVAILRQLGADDSTYGDPPKPKWMRWPTYSRLALELRAVRYRHGMAMAAEFRQAFGTDLEDFEEAELMVERLSDLAGSRLDE